MRSAFLLFLFLSFQSMAQDEPIEPTTAEPIIHQIYRLVDQRNSASPLFKNALHSKDTQIQKAALLGLGRIGGKEVLDRVVPFLKNKNEVLRQLAALAAGLSKQKAAAEHLWTALENEKSDLVKKELYLALGNLGQDQLVSKMLAQLEIEKSAEIRAAIFQGLGIAMVFHRDLKDNYHEIDFKRLLELFSVGDDNAAVVGLFLGRLSKIEDYLKPQQLLPLTKKKMSPLAESYLIRLLSKVTANLNSKGQQDIKRRILAYAVQKSESKDLAVKLESIKLLGNFLNLPQSLIQLGKFHISSNPIVAQTALKTIADSELNTPEVIKLLIDQLKSNNASMVVEAMGGLVKRQTKDEMTWVLNFFAHPTPYVKIKLMRMLNNKTEQDKDSKNNFDNVIKMFSHDPNKKISAYAKSLLNEQQESDEPAAKSPSYALALVAAQKQIILKTTIGEITIQLSQDAPFTSWHFVNNIKNGYFNGGYFNRVIGDFVAQGGDHIGDGSGSVGHTIREEINLLPHEPMSVGVATAGKDTGSSQFFINTSRNLHLDRNYTIFGKVIKGQEIVLNLTHGIEILSVEVN